MSLPLSVRALMNVRDMYRKGPKAAIETGRVYTEMRNDLFISYVAASERTSYNANYRSDNRIGGIVDDVPFGGQNAQLCH